MKPLIESILQDVDFKQNPYFTTLYDGSFSKEDFTETQVQFYNAVVFFSRPMAALAAKIPTPKLRMEIVRNVWEEHGEGELTKVHGNTFVTFLDRLSSIKQQEIDDAVLWPEVRIFNTTLVGCCVMDDYLVGAAMMGMIERMFCEISSIIGKGVVKRGWFTEENLIHYDLHSELDIKHSQDFFNVLEPAWESSQDERYLIDQGLRLGAFLFNGLYLGLYEHRQRRLTRP